MDNKAENRNPRNCSIVAVASGSFVSVGTAWNDPMEYPEGGRGIDAVAKIYQNVAPAEAARIAAQDFAAMADARGWDCSTVCIDAALHDKAGSARVGSSLVMWGAVRADGTDEDSKDPKDIRARAARSVAQEALDKYVAEARNRPISVIVTAGPTNERIDAVMKITNMSTGALGAKIAETLLNADGNHHREAARIGKLYYLSPKLACKPVVPDGQAYKLELVQIESAEDLLGKLTDICKNDEIGLIVHSCAVGDYKARYSARAEDIASEVARKLFDTAGSGTVFTMDDKPAIESAVMDVLRRPASAAKDSTKMSSYEPNLFTMMDLTPKVIGSMRELAPHALIFGFKLLENVDPRHLFDVASKLRQKNDVNYIIANDLAKIKNGEHPAIFIGRDHVMDRDAVFAECRTKQDIAEAICRIAFGQEADILPSPTGIALCKPYWHVVAANNMNTDVRIEGFSRDKAEAWRLMAGKFRETAAEMVPDVAVPEVEFLDMKAGFDFDDDGKRRVMIGADTAQVFDGDDMWYYNLVPMSYEAVRTD